MIEIFRTLAMLRSLKTTETGAAAIEYGLLVALIAVVIAGTLRSLGLQLFLIFTNMAGLLPAPS